MLQKLRSLFNRRAAAPEVPPEVVNDKAVQKAVFKARRARHWKWLKRFLIGSTALSITLQVAPGFVSQSFDDHMAERGYPAKLQDHFHTSSIRVYDRVNPLYPFHFAGMTTRLEWREALDDPRDSIGLLDIALEPVNIGAKVIFGFGQMLPGNKLDAWSISGSGAVEDRYCYIRPPGEVSLKRYLRDFSGIRAEKLNFRNSQESLSHILYAYVMLHEARHCDQDKRIHASPLNESDADLYAFKLMQAYGVKPDLLSEAHDILLNLRTLNSVIGGDGLHTTTFTLERRGQTALDAHNDAATFWRLRQILIDADALNRYAFAEDAKTGSRYYYLAAGMLEAGLFRGDTQLTNAAETFLKGVEYFDRATNGAIVDRSFDEADLDFSFFSKEYKPVPDRLEAPKRPRPSA